MVRDYHINGPALLYVKGGASASPTIQTRQEFGLAEDPVRVTPVFRHKEIMVDSWGAPGGVPAEIQWMMGWMDISLSLIHFDTDILEELVRLSMGGTPLAGTNTPAIAGGQAYSFGQMARAGTRLGGGVPRFALGNLYFTLLISSPDDNRPWRFFFCYLPDSPVTWPLGVEKEILPLRIRAIPYPLQSASLPTGSDPAGVTNGVPLGATGYPLFDRNNGAVFAPD